MKTTLLILTCWFTHFALTAQITLKNPAIANKVDEVKPPAPKAVAFRLSPFSNSLSLPANVSSVLNLTVKEFDLGNNTSGNSFVAPENGIYHFDVRVNISYPVTDYQDYLRFYLMLNKNGNVFEKTILMNAETDKTPFHTLAISTTVMLKKGDAITASYNADTNTPGKSATATELSFSGFKINMDGGSASTSTGTIK